MLEESFEECARNILQSVNVSYSDDSWSSIDPATCSVNDKTQSHPFSDNQFEGIFYQTSIEMTVVTLNVVLVCFSVV